MDGRGEWTTEGVEVGHKRGPEAGENRTCQRLEPSVGIGMDGKGWTVTRDLRRFLSVHTYPLILYFVGVTSLIPS